METRAIRNFVISGLFSIGRVRTILLRSPRHDAFAQHICIEKGVCTQKVIFWSFTSVTAFHPLGAAATVIGSERQWTYSLEASRGNCVLCRLGGEQGGLQIDT